MTAITAGQIDLLRAMEARQRLHATANRNSVIAGEPDDLALAAKQDAEADALLAVLAVVEQVGKCESFAKYQGFKCICCGAFNNSGDVSHDPGCLELARAALAQGGPTDGR